MELNLLETNFSDYSMIFNIVAVVLLGFGFLLGFWRGLRRALHRLIWIVVVTLLLFFTTSLIANVFMDIDVSGMNIVISGEKVTSIREFTLNTVATQFSLTPEQLAECSDFIMAIVILLLSGFLFLPVYLIFNIIGYTLFKIFNLVFIHDKGKPKYRLFGGLVGVVTTCLILVTVFSPVTGYLNAYKTVSTAFKESDQPLDGSEDIDKFLSDYESLLCVSVPNALGAKAFQLAYFNGLAKVNYKGNSILLTDEIDNVSGVLPILIKYTGDNNADIDVSELKTAFSAIMKSKLVQSGIKPLTPIIKGAVEKADFGTESFQVSLKSLVLDCLDSITEMDNEQISNCFNSLCDVFVQLADVTKSDFDVYSLNFASLGKSIDGLISSGLITNERMGAFVGELIDSFSNSVGENANFKDTLSQIKEKFASGADSYQTEFSAVGKILEAVKIIDQKDEDGNSTFAFETDGDKVGKIIDQTLALNSKILDKQLIDGFIVNLVDEFMPADESFNSTKATIKERIHGDIVYENEFKAVGKIFEAVKIADKKDEDGNSTFSFETDGKEIGKIIDQTLALDSKIVDKQLIDGYIKNLVDDFVVTENGYESAKNSIIKRLDKSFSYETELGYVQKLIALSKTEITIETIENKDENGLTIGDKLDEIAPSVLVGDCALTVIDSAFNSYASGHEKFESITGVLKQNFEDLKTNAKVMGKKDGYTYSEITAAFGSVYTVLSSETENMITGNEIFNNELAVLYENRLSELQENILVRQNGARATAAYVSAEVKGVVLKMKQTYSSPETAVVADKLDQLASYVQAYVDYLNREITPDSKNFNEPYNIDIRDDNDSSVTGCFADVNDFTKFYGNMGESSDRIRVNKPFSYFYELLSEATSIE